MTTTKWSLDDTHSEVHFKVKHMMISTVTGQFSKFSSSIETIGEDFRTAKIQFTADVDSISTNNEQRDLHLKNGDFFDVPNYPHITFRSTKIVKADDENYKVHGELTMRGITKDIVLDVEFGGIMQDPWGNTRTGFTIAGKINRHDYAISFGGVTETGGLLLGDEVKISANAEFVKESALVEA